MNNLIKDNTAITPFFPEVIDNELDEIVLELKEVAGRLSCAMHPVTAKAIAELVLNMNSYYSNLIEGHFTHPADIEKALKKEYSADDSKRIMQLESEAHILVNKAMRQKLINEPELNICSTTFLCWLHKKFYDHLPTELRLVKSTDDNTVTEIVPGELRRREVQVANHLAPAAAAISPFMELFKDNYTPIKIKNPIKRNIAIGASHHRLAWIHPFLDGNGRVVRLFSEAYFINEHLDAGGLWSISRGLAVYKDDYYSHLQSADEKRLHDNDGRGNLSDRRLKEFCVFFLKTAIDQIKFMTTLFETDGILDRINTFTDIMMARGELRDEARYVLTELYLKGSLKRGEAIRAIGRSVTIAYPLIQDLIKKGLVVSPGNREALTINFPARYVSYFFPKLYPPNVEASLS